MIVHFHDDWDGIVSAALLAEWCRLTRARDRFQFRAVNYGRDMLPVDDDLAVVDFQYDPRAAIWFDHHQHPFASDADLADYRFRRITDYAGLLVWEIKPCCAEVVRDRLFGPLDFPDLIASCRRFDTADHPSVHDWFAAREPDVQLMHAFYHLPDAIKQRMGDQLLTRSLTRWVNDPDIRPVIETTIRQTTQRLGQLSTVLRRSGSVVWGDLVEAQVGRVAFAAEYYWPGLDYAAQLSGTMQHCRINLTANAWTRPNRHDLASIARQFGGGGHPNAAGIDGGSYTRGLTILAECVRILNT